MLSPRNADRAADLAARYPTVRVAADNNKIGKADNPADAITLPGKRRGVPRPAFTEAVAGRLLRAARDHAKPIVKWGTRFGALGLIPLGPGGRVTFEGYFTNGFNDGLITASEAGTRIAFGREASSWVSTGQNMPISAEQVTQVFGQGNVRSLGGKFNLSPESASSGLASLLPALIDHLTPQGRLDSEVPLSASFNALRGRFNV